MRAAFYTSAHGYGHASRSYEIVKELVNRCPDAEIQFMSDVPDSFFAADNHQRIHRRACKLDVGIRQIDSLKMDIAGTIDDLNDLAVRSEKIIVGETSFLEKNEMDLVLVDLPFLAFEAAARVKIPTWGICNFTWDWIYEDYLDTYPDFKPHIERIRTAYSLADGVFRLPFHHDMPQFKTVIDTPLVARRSKIGRKAARSRLNIKADEKVILLSFGGFGQNLNLMPKVDSNLKLITSDPSPWPGNQFIHLGNMELKKRDLRYCDLVAAADVVVTKLGYGIVSECIANQTAIIYTPRGQFREYPLLVKAVKNAIPSSEIPENAFSDNTWIEACLNIMEKKMPPISDTSGIDFIIDKLLKMY